MTEKIKNLLTDTILFLYGSLWTAAGVYMAINIVRGSSDIWSWGKFFELYIFLNLAVFITYIGVKTQIKLYREWNDEL